MTLKFQNLTEAPKTYNFPSGRTHDFVVLLYCLIVNKEVGATNLNTALDNFLKLSTPSNKSFYQNEMIRKLILISSQLHLGDIKVNNGDKKSGQENIKLAEEYAKNITLFSDLYFLTAYEDEIKDTKNVDKVVFMYACNRKGNIDSSTLTSKKYQHQIFENKYNYLLDFNNFTYTFSAYTIASNNNDNPDKYLTKVGSKKMFVSKSEAEAIYNNEVGKTKKKGKTVEKTNSQIIETLYDMFTVLMGDEAYEYRGGSGKLNKNASFKTKRNIIGNEIFGTTIGFNFESTEDVNLTWDNSWQKKYTVKQWDALMNKLSKDRNYKEYYFGNT